MELLLYNESHLNSILTYQIGNTPYSGTPAEAVACSLERADYYPVLCLEGKHLVSFFVLDFGKDKRIYSANHYSILLRSFSTDIRFLRKGYAGQALSLLNAFVKQQFPKVNEIVLGVNEKNTAAQMLYKKAGFIVSENTVVGKKGTQLIMTHEIQ